MFEVSRTFDFIADDTLRDILISDYAEAQKALEQGLVKTVLVLSGSLIEAMLTDQLALHDPQLSPKLLKTKDLGPLVDLAVDRQVLTERHRQLSHAVRNWRNLIHPGRQERTGEIIDRDTAHVALHLTNMVASHLGQLRLDRLGSTAAQVVAKMAGDPGARDTIRELITAMHPAEAKQLLFRALPEAYLPMFLKACEDNVDELSTHDHTVFLAARDACKWAFASVDDATRQAYMSQLASVIRSQNEDTVYMYETAFLPVNSFKFAANPDRKTIVADLIQRIDSRPTSALTGVLQGQLKYLDKDTVDKLVRKIILSIPAMRERHVEAVIMQLESMYWDAAEGTDQVIRENIERAISYYQATGRQDLADAFTAALDAISIPF